MDRRVAAVGTEDAVPQVARDGGRRVPLEGPWESVRLLRRPVFATTPK